MTFDNPYSIGSIALASIGIILTTCVSGIFLKHRDTPIVKASGKVSLKFELKLKALYLCIKIKPSKFHYLYCSYRIQNPIASQLVSNAIAKTFTTSIFSKLL